MCAGRGGDWLTLHHKGKAHGHKESIQGRGHALPASQVALCFGASGGTTDVWGRLNDGQMMRAAPHAPCLR